MDADIEEITRNGKRHSEIIVLPDADVSEPDNESDSDIEENLSDT